MKKILLSVSFFSLTFFAQAQSWVDQATGFETASRGVNEIQIVDANTVWALAYDGADTENNIQEFTRTTDGGSTWTAGIIDIGDTTQSINNICPVSATTAWISAIDSASGLGGIYMTTDGGISWELKTSTEFTTAGESFLNGVIFFDANNGVSFGDPEGGEFEIYTTNDAGTTWTRVPAASVPNPLSGEYGYNGGYVHIGSTIWMPTNKGRLYKSTDMGLTWSVAQAPLSDFGSAAQSGNVHFSTVNDGCLLKKVGTTYTFYTTTNGGTTWSAATPYTGAYYVIDYVPGTNILVATSAGTPSGSAYSLNNGTTWTEIDNGTQRGVVAMLNGSTGWCGGFSVDPLTGGIFKLNGSLSNEMFTASQFKIYPNPANSIVTISSENSDSFNVKVMDLAGKVMMNQELSGVENTVDVSTYAAGIYLFEVKAGNRTDTFKVVKN